MIHVQQGRKKEQGYSDTYVTGEEKIEKGYSDTRATGEEKRTGLR